MYTAPGRCTISAEQASIAATRIANLRLTETNSRRRAPRPRERANAEETSSLDVWPRRSRRPATASSAGQRPWSAARRRATARHRRRVAVPCGVRPVTQRLVRVRLPSHRRGKLLAWERDACMRRASMRRFIQNFSIAGYASVSSRRYLRFRCIRLLSWARASRVVAVSISVRPTQRLNLLPCPPPSNRDSLVSTYGSGSCRDCSSQFFFLAVVQSWLHLPRSSRSSRTSPEGS